MIVRHDRPGQNTPLDEDVWPAIGRFGRRDGTAVLVAPCWALAAARLVDELMAPGAVEIMGVPKRVIGIVPADQPSLIGHDGSGGLVLLRLDAAVDGIVPFGLYEGEAEAGQTFLMIGHGGSGDALSGPLGQGGLLRRCTNRVTGVNARWLWFDFDPPTSPDCTEAEGISGPGPGGAVALMPVDGRLLVVGIEMAQQLGVGAQGYYGTIEYHARVSRHAAWIRSVLDGPF